MTGLWRNIWVGLILAGSLVSIRWFIDVPGVIAVILSMAIVVNSYRIGEARRVADEQLQRASDLEHRIRGVERVLAALERERGAVR